MFRNPIAALVTIIVTLGPLVAAAQAPPSASPADSVDSEGSQGAQGSQDSQGSDSAAAAAFDEGARAAEELRWADAAASFSASYALSGAWSALYNAALALRALDRHREARDAFARLLDEHAATMNADERASVETLRQESQERLATFELHLDPLAHQVEVDGDLREDDGSRPLRLEVVAGERSLLVLRPEHRAFTWRGTLHAGQALRLDVTLEPEPTGTSRLRWVAIVGAVVAAAVVGTVIAVVALRPGDQSAPPPLAPTVLTL